MAAVVGSRMATAEGSRAETARAGPDIVPRREYGDSYGGQGQGAPGTAAVRSRAAVGTTAAMDKVRVRVGVALGTTAVRGTAAVTTVARDPPPGLRRPGFGSGPTSPQRDNGGFGAPRSNPIFPAAAGSPQPPFRFSPGRRRTVCPLCRVAPLPLATSSDNAARRAMASNHRKRQGSAVHVSAADAKKVDDETTPRLALAVPAARLAHYPSFLDSCDVVVFHRRPSRSVISASAPRPRRRPRLPPRSPPQPRLSSPPPRLRAFAFAFLVLGPSPPFSAALPADLPAAPSSPFFARSIRRQSPWPAWRNRTIRWTRRCIFLLAALIEEALDVWLGAHALAAGVVVGVRARHRLARDHLASPPRGPGGDALADGTCLGDRRPRGCRS